jgi:F5/8 type C domain
VPVHRAPRYLPVRGVHPAAGRGRPGRHPRRDRARGDLFEGNEVTDASGIGILFGSDDDADPSAFLANLAQKRPARQSSTQGKSTAALAVDGVTTAGGGAQTRLEDDPSWQVDLGATKPLWQVDISARGGSEPALTDYWVFVSDSPFKDGLTPQQQAARPGVWSSHQGGGTDRAASVRADTSGRYVMVQAAGRRQLSLAEVAVQSGAEIAVGNTIRNNYVHGNGVEFTGAPGIFGGYSRQTTISHNEVGNQSYSGISFGWGGWHTDAVTPTANANVMADNTISDNLIYRVMGQRTDGGPIYTNGSLGTSLDHGLTTSGNVTFGTDKTSFAFYSDEGSSYTTLDGNVQYADSGNFNGGCSTVGHFLIENNYTSGARDQYICNRVGNDFRDGGGNVKISGNPAPGEIPTAVLTGAGLQGPYQQLLTRNAPELVVASPITGHKVLLSGSGFSPSSTINVDGKAVGAATYLGPNHLVATLPSSVVEAKVSVTTAAGTSEQIYTFDPALDVALGKPATQSTTAFDAPAGQAVDGNDNGSYGANSLAHTDLEASPWWQVDLGSDQALRSINVYNRTDCCADRDTDFWVFTSSQPFDHSLTPAEQAAQPGVWSSHQSGQMGRPTSLPLPAGATGRYVMVQLTGTNYLALAEVQVFSQQ